MAKKSKHKFVKCKNNPKFLVDTAFMDEKTKYDQEKVSNYPGHEKYGFMKVTGDNFSEIAFVNFTDPHFFGDGFDDERCSLALDWIRNVANARAVFGGDVFDIASLSGKTDPHQSILNNADSLDLAGSNAYIGKIADKTICGIGGNHDAAYANRLRDTGISPLKHVLEKFGIQYFEYSALIQMRIGEHNYNVLLAHTGAGRAPLDGGIKYALEFSSRTGIRIDALFLGHNHISAHGVFPCQYKNYDENGKLLGVLDHQIQVLVDPSFQGENEHFLSTNIDRPNTNACVTVLSERPNPFYNSEDNRSTPYVLCVKRFPLLNENSNEYSLPAIKYMIQMEDKSPTILKEVKELLDTKEAKTKIHASTEMLKTLAKKTGGK